MLPFRVWHWGGEGGGAGGQLGGKSESYHVTVLKYNRTTSMAMRAASM